MNYVELDTGGGGGHSTLISGRGWKPDPISNRSAHK